MIDTHLHLLPGIDDGARDLDMSLAMIQQLMDDGVRAVIVTPHQYNGAWQNPRLEILQAVAGLRAELAERGIDFNVHPGAEVRMSSDLESHLARGHLMSMADRKKHLLLELPKLFTEPAVVNVVNRIKAAGMQPIIAHPERAPLLVENPSLVMTLRELGCAMQLTAASVSGDFGGDLQRVSRRWLHDGLVEIVASDAHRDAGRRAHLKRAYKEVRRWLGEAHADLLFRGNPQRVLDGETLLQPEPVPRRRFLGLF